MVNLKAHNYPMFYRGEHTLNKSLMLTYMSTEEIDDLNAEIANLPEDKKTARAEQLITSINETIDDMLENFPNTPEKQESAQKDFNELTLEEQVKAVKQAQLFLASFLASFYNTISMMVHGQSLTNLVTAAEAGDDEAFRLT